MPKKTQFVPKRKDFLVNEEILNTRGDQAFYMGAENAKTKSADKSAETGGYHENPHSDVERTITMENAITLKSFKK